MTYEQPTMEVLELESDSDIIKTSGEPGDGGSEDWA